MELAVERYGLEYGIDKKVMGKHCKLYCQRSWNNSAWMAIQSTESMVRLLKDQMLQTKRINQDKELMGVSG